MKKHKGPMTAEELMKQLQDDPEYRRQEAVRQEKWQRLEDADARLEEPILAELNSASFNGESIESVVNNCAPLPEKAVEILLRSLKSFNQGDLEDQSGQSRLAESIVRALAATRLSFDGRPLIECFEKTSDESLKWAIANTIAITAPQMIDEWLSEKLTHRYWGKTLRELGLER